ncbi:hypothetical protein VSR69_33060 [Paraburkholderia phytofirmans]|uniref:hypothetical protein n=1 Tax=Paraburkholderia sp. BL9I2N2 TaxID=1938809 RepID=UPI00104C7D9A|nr:hypothetical protein [Paraburkholderia sp. BL9I2N2]TCK96009.1 hypothetical protein B0G74_2652 [Paraburkholderia sp. BL9I2N2]
MDPQLQLASQVAAAVADQLPQYSWARLGIQSILLVIAGAIGGFLGSLIREHAKNWAALRTIRKLTRAVEDIKTDNAKQLAELGHQNSIFLEQAKAQNQLRFAALDKRLNAHQEAFTLWRRLLARAHEDDVHEIVRECYVWWERNCLYLEPTARNAFNQAFWAASHHKVLLETPVRDEAAIEAIKRNWSAVQDAGTIIMDAASLPAINDREREDLIKTPGQNVPGTGLEPENRPK